MAQRFNIIDAPSKWSLMIGFFDRPNPTKVGQGTRRPVDFTVVEKGSTGNGKVLEVIITTLSWEDGSGESWCFEGRSSSKNGEPSLNLKGWFRTSDRKGWMDVVPFNDD